MMTLTDILKQLIATPSQSSKGNDAIIMLLSQWFKDYDTQIQDWERADSVKGKNLIVTIPGESDEKTLIVVGHLDTVPSNASWQTNPLELTQKNGNLYGLGTCDTKGSIAALIEAVFSLEGKPAYTTVLVFDGDEEMASTGAKKYLESLSVKNPHFIFLEPTNKQVHIGQRALLKCTLTAHGKSIHSSQATVENNEKYNAIYKMQNVLHVLAQDMEILDKQQDVLLGTNTQNFGVMNGGTARNVLAEKCVVDFERRLLPSINPEQELQRLIDLVGKTDPDVVLTLDEIEPGFFTQESSPLVSSILRHMQHFFPEAKKTVFPAWSEAGLFADKGECVIIGAGNLVETAHRANEYVEKEELEKFTNIFSILIKKGI